MSPDLNTLVSIQKMYIDPSVMTYAIQAIAGIVIAVGAVVGIYYRKAKNKLNESFDLEEKSKVVEDDLIVYSEADSKEKEEI